MIIRERRKIVAFYSFIILAFTFAFNSCRFGTDKCNDQEKAGYRVIENACYDSCSVYSMIMERPNSYVFRFATSGQCSTLTKEIYLKEYAHFLRKNSGSLHFEGRKRITLDFPDMAKIDSLSIKKIALLTGDVINKQVDIYKVSPGNAILQVN